MTTFNQATELLHKRCDYIEARLGHHSELVSKPAAGKHYRHFILQGLVHTAFYTAVSTYLQTLERFSLHSDASSMSDMHLNELGVLESEAKLTDQTINLQTLRDFGLDLSQYPSHIGLGYDFRRGGLFAPITQAYGDTYHHPSDYELEDLLTAHYRGRELFPDDSTAEWEVQAEDLLYKARSQSLKSLLTSQHVIASDGRAGALSLRRAGFPANQFQGISTSSNISPRSVYRSLDDDAVPLDAMKEPVVVRHCPSLIMVTIECPDNLDELIASEAIEDVPLTYYFKHIMVPHWIGLENSFDHTNNAEGEEGKPLSQSRLYDPALVSTFADTLTSASISDGNGDNGNAYGDLVIYTPSDSSLSATEIPNLSDARSVTQGRLRPHVEDLDGKVNVASMSANYRYGSASPYSMFRDNSADWAQARSTVVTLNFETKDKYRVYGLRVGHGGPDRKWPRTISLFTKAADDPSNINDSGWYIHDTVTLEPSQRLSDVMFKSPTSETNLFKIAVSASQEHVYNSIQYFALLSVVSSEEGAVTAP